MSDTLTERSVDSPLAGGEVLLPKKLVRKRDWISVDFPSPDSPAETKNSFSRASWREREGLTDNHERELESALHGFSVGEEGQVVES